MTLWTEDPRVVAAYDVKCLGRLDHDYYLGLAAELEASRVVDLGCGTGVLAVELARSGCHVVGVDPAGAMIDAARARPGGELVSWTHGTAADLPAGEADLVIMNGHVAQYFIDAADWATALDEVRRALRPGGRLAFESLAPAGGWWERWSPEFTYEEYPHPDGGTFASWVEPIERGDGDESFWMTHRGHTVLPDGTHLTNDETLRFRNEAELRQSLAAAGFEIGSLWGDWDRTPIGPDSDEMIFVARVI